MMQTSQLPACSCGGYIWAVQVTVIITPQVALPNMDQTAYWLTHPLLTLDDNLVFSFLVTL